jgi:hypothetical protein
MFKMRLVSASFALALAAAIPFAAHAAQGLNGSYYTTSSQIGSLATALSDISGQTPAATFTANTVCFPSCGNVVNDGSTISEFLGGNATGLTNNSLTNLSDHVVVLTGYFDAPTAGNYTFGLQSDDGSELLLNNKVALDNDLDHSIGGPSGSVYLSAGWTPIEIVQFEDSGTTGLTVTVDGDPLGGSWIATSATSAVPEPATWAMLILGVAMIGFAVRRHRAGLTLAA